MCPNIDIHDFKNFINMNCCTVLHGKLVMFPNSQPPASPEILLSVRHPSGGRQKIQPPTLLQNCSNLKGSSALCHSIVSFTMTRQKWDSYPQKEETEIFHHERSPGLPKFAILFQFKFYQNLGEKLSKIVT